jgi:protein-disulfide isomerase
MPRHGPRHSLFGGNKTMHSKTLIVLSLLSTLIVPACGEDTDPALVGRVEALEQRLAKVETAVSSRGRPRGPDPSVTYALPVDASDPVRGAKAAKVTVVAVSEFACPYCALAAPVLDQVLTRWGDVVRVVDKPFVIHPDVAMVPSQAACAAHKQGRYADFASRLWQQAWALEPKPRLDRAALAPEALSRLADTVGLNRAQFAAEMNGEACRGEIARNRQQLAAIGVNGTPTFFVNGRLFVGPRTVDGFSRVIEAEIAKADQAVASGVRLEDYYDTLVRNGKKQL